MRNIGNFLADPGLHLLGIALLVIYLTFGGSGWLKGSAAEAPLPVCSSCNVRYLPDRTCSCVATNPLATATR